MKFWRKGCSALTGLALVAASILSAQPAQASSALFDKVKGILSGTIDPDHIEMARFTISHPEDASVVYQHAVMEDLPFFALIGAAKAARKSGKFSYNDCVFPVTSIDRVFAAADSTIDDTAGNPGKQQTKDVIGAAKTYGADAAKAGTQAAKDELNQQLMQAIPYFGQIKTICTFAFETDFKAERNIQAVAGETSRKVKQAYDELSSGDVVSGVATLVSLGVGANVACELVDNAVGGGIIGRTPLLGDLVKGACAGFAGKVLDGLHDIVHGGLGALQTVGGYAYDSAKAAYCEVKSWFGGECASDAPPPNAVALGIQFCQPHGGHKIIYYQKSKSPDDFTAYCNDGTSLEAKPGKSPVVTTVEQRAAALEAYRVKIDAAVLQSIADFKTRWQNTYAAQCPTGDAKCASDLFALRNQTVADLLAEHAKSPFEDLLGLARVTNYWLSFGRAEGIVQEAKFRVLPGIWAKGYGDYWGAKCEDEQCRTAVRFATFGVSLSIAQKHQTSALLYEQLTTPIYADAGELALGLVAESKARSIEFNKKTTAAAGEAWEILTNAIWGKQCLDDACVAAVKQLSGAMKLAAKLVQMGKPDSSSLEVQGIVGKEYGPKFKAAVDASKARAAAKETAAKAALTKYRAAHPGVVTTRPVWRPSTVGHPKAFRIPASGLRPTMYTAPRGPVGTPTTERPAGPATGGRPGGPIRPFPGMRVTPSPSQATPVPVGRPAPIRIVPRAPTTPAPTASPSVEGRPAPIRIRPSPQSSPTPAATPTPSAGSRLPVFRPLRIAPTPTPSPTPTATPTRRPLLRPQ